MKISEKHKEKYLSEDLWNKAKFYFHKFYPNKKLNPNIYNDLGTHHSYAFFYEIWSNPNINNYEDIGTIYFDKRVNADND